MLIHASTVPRNSTVTTQVVAEGRIPFRHAPWTEEDVNWTLGEDSHCYLEQSLGRFQTTLQCTPCTHTWPSFYSLCPDFSVLISVPGAPPRKGRPRPSPILMPLSKPTSDFTFCMELSPSLPTEFYSPFSQLLQFLLLVSLSLGLWNVDISHGHIRYGICLITPQSVLACGTLQVIQSFNTGVSITSVCHISHSVLRIKSRKRWSLV